MRTHKQVLVYIEGEGGGERGAQRKSRDGDFRQAWRSFLQPLVDHAKEKGVVFFKCIPGRGGSTTEEAFSKPLPSQDGALRILLIDSEKPVNDISEPWKELGCKPPSWATNDHCYLMVQCLETWLVSDVEGLAKHYNDPKRCFKESVIPAWPDLEKADRKTLQASLKKATADCSRPYRHADGNLIVAKLNREKIKKLPSAKRLFEDLIEVIEEYASS